MTIPTFDYRPYYSTAIEMLNEIAVKKATEFFGEPQISSLSSITYATQMLEIVFQNEVLAHIYIHPTSICCGSNVCNIVGDLPQDVVDCFMDCIGNTGLLYIVKAKHLPTKSIRLSSTTGVYVTPRDDAIWSEVPAGHHMGRHGFALFYERARKHFPELKIAYNFVNQKKAPTYHLNRGFYMRSIGFQLIGDKVLFVYGVNGIPVQEIPFYPALLQAIPTITDMLSISTATQFTTTDPVSGARTPTKQALVDGGWPVILSAHNPGNRNLLHIHGLTKEAPEQVKTPEPAPISL